MAEPAGIQERVTRLEHEMAEVRYLATKAEREGSEFRAVIGGQTGVLDALRETRLEQGKTLAAHGGRLGRLEEKFDNLDEKFDVLDGKVGSLDGKVGSLEEKVDNLDGRVGTLEEKVDSGFAEMREGFAQVETKFTVLKAGQERITELLTTHLGAPGGSEQ